MNLNLSPVRDDLNNPRPAPNLPEKSGKLKTQDLNFSAGALRKMVSSGTGVRVQDLAGGDR